MTPEGENEIVGFVERITFHNPNTGYTVAQIQEQKRGGLTTAVGNMPSAQPGETVRCFGRWGRHLVHGSQFEVESFRTEAPSDIIGIKKYLGSGLIRGIGPIYAERIVEKFGTATLDVIDKTPQKLQEVPGIGKKRYEQIIGCWSEQRTIREVMIFLQQYGISPAYAQKIFKVYRSGCIEKLEKDPYCLARDVIGIGFRHADRIAKEMGMAHDADERIDAGIEFVLQQLSGEGHVCYPKDELIQEAERILETEPQRIEERIASLEKEERLIVANLPQGPFVWARPLFLSEVGIAREVRRLLQSPAALREVETEKAIEWVQKKLRLKLAEKQVLAVSRSLTEKLHIITGGPGTGKSTITNAILTVTEKLSDKIILAAPTGRAAKRMAEITHKKASTIHSILEFDFKTGGFKRGRENPIECDLLIVDEASMIDTRLMYSLLRAVPESARLVLVGDINQLPSVGPGNVLKDMISSRRIRVTMLNEIFRQAQGSRIITNSHMINRGEYPDIRNLSDSDFFFIEEEEPEKLKEEILALVCDRLPKKYGYDPKQDIQVLAPMKKGVIGTANLNDALQQRLTPKGEPIFRSGMRLLEQDKVMQIRNNYKKEVYNGDIGTVVKIDRSEQKLLIRFDERIVPYSFSDLDEIVLAYAVSIHKYQGSECRCVVIPVHTQHFKLLHRNLLYTGVTRGKSLVVLVGTKKALFLAVKNDEVKRRYTALKLMLQGTPIQQL